MDNVYTEQRGDCLKISHIRHWIFCLQIKMRQQKTIKEYMKMKTYDEFTDFIDSRIESCVEVLQRQSSQFKAICNKNRELTLKLDSLEIDAQQKDILEKYLENNFHMNAAEKPAIYVQGFRDALKLLLKLDLI